MNRKSATYQQLQRSLAEDVGCPVCRIGLRAAHSYMDTLLWESVNDPDRRNVLDQTLGLCGRHSRELLRFPGQRLGVAIIEQAVLREALRRLQGHSSPQHNGRGLGQRLRQWLRFGYTQDPASHTEICPACQQQQASEARAVEALLEYLLEDLDTPLQEAGGLCWAHLQMALAQPTDAATRQALVAGQQEIWAQRIGELNEFIRKNDHRFRHEPISSEERESIERAIAILTGEYPLR